jgi:NADPH-dependent curcumin reductase CurA
MVQNKGLYFKSPPQGWPKPGENLAVEAREFDLDAPAPSGGITVKQFYTSFDPYMRGRMRAPEIKSYAPPFTVDAPFTSRGIGKVLKSDNAGFKEGDVVIGGFEITEYCAVNAEGVKGVRKLDNPYKLDPKIYIGALGMPGLTAYSSLYEIAPPEKGKTIFISAASGAVGQIVGQLAKHEGMHVIGSVGSDEKLDFIIKELGFDGGFNYKKEKASEALARLAPKGIDTYYENVGGEQLEAAISALNENGRIGMHPLHFPLSHTLT